MADKPGHAHEMMDGEKGMACHKQKHEMMVEEQDILLQTVQLLKEVAKDGATKGKAEALEKRIQAMVVKHKEMHDQMEKMMDKCDMKKDGAMHHPHMMDKSKPEGSAPPAAK
jgi:hypothetical protein